MSLIVDKVSLTTSRPASKGLCFKFDTVAKPCMPTLEVHFQYSLSEKVRDDPKLLDDGGETPKSQGRGCWFYS
jgi:hypothetical protein